MGVRVLQRQPKALRLDGWALRRRACAMLVALGVPNHDIGISIVGERAIRRLNRDYRGVNKQTDVLSFPFDDNELESSCPILSFSSSSSSTDSGGGPPLFEYSVRDLGDIVLGAARIAADARECGRAYESQAEICLAHGLCHLAGHAHSTVEAAKRMRAAESILLAAAAQVAADDAWPRSEVSLEPLTTVS